MLQLKESAIRIARGVGKYALIAVLYLVVIGVVLEIGARALFPSRVPVDSAFVPHPVYGVTYRPHAAGEYVILTPPGAPRTSALFRLNALGLRDRELGPKAAGEVRIFLLGDSFTFSPGVADEATTARWLEQCLNGLGLPVRFTVINGGTGGYGPWQERGVLLEKGFPLEPDLVIHQLLLANDIGDTLRKVDIIQAAHDPQREARWLRYRFNAYWQMRLESWVWEHSRAYQQFRHVTRWRWGVVDLLNHVPGLTPVPLPAIPRPAERPWALEPLRKVWDKDLTRGWELMQADILTIQQDCLERGIPYLAYAQPDGASFIDLIWQGSLAPFAGKVGEEEYDRSKDTALLNSFFAAQNIPYLDPGAAFRAHPDPISLYFPTDGHLSAEGLRFMADVLCRGLEERQLTGRLVQAAKADP